MKYAAFCKYREMMQTFILALVLVAQPLNAVPSNTTPPAFKYTPPSLLTAREGESLLLRCSATGRPVPVVTWLKDGWAIKNGQDGIRLSDDELAVTSLHKVHKGEYTCRAQNLEGQVEHGTTLYIQGAPYFTSPPQNTTAKEGQDAMFSCRADGYPTNIKYSWLYNGEPVSTSEEIRGRHSALGDGTFIIYNVAAEDSGTVTCRACNGYGTSPTASATLLVQFPARVFVMPPIRYAGLSLQAVLPCPAVAVPPVTTATWRKDGQVILIHQDRRFSLGGNMSLVIENVEKRDSGRYSCTPYNYLGTLGESTGTRLIIKAPPYFTLLPRRIYEAEIGKELAIPCQGSGDPTPHASWVKLDDSLDDKGDTERISWKGGNLTIDSVVKDDHGRWQCILSNAVASIRTDVLINVKYTTPHAVSNITVATSRHNAQISWIPGYDGGYAQHFMIWYKRADTGDHSWQTHSVEGFRRAATVSNLEPDTIYQFALLPENILGSGQFSKTITAKTKELPPATPTMEPETVPPPSRLQSHVDKKSGLLILMWQPPLDSREDDLLGYVIEFRMLLGSETKEDISPATPTNKSAAQLSVYSAPLRRTKRSGHSIMRRLRRKKRDADSTTAPSTTTTTSKPQNKWSPWASLAPIQPNETSYVVPANKIYRDQLYEFQVFAASKSAYSVPTASITISTKSMMAYPVRVPEPWVGDQTRPAAVAGIAAGILFVLIAIVLTTVWCYHRRRGKDALGNPAFTFGRVEDEAFETRSRSKSESPSRRSVESKTSSKGRHEKNGPIAKLKKKMLKVDIDIGHTYATTDETAGLARKVSASGQSPAPPLQNDKIGRPVIRKICRAPDGKFHVSDESSARSESVIDAGETDSLVAPMSHTSTGFSPTRGSIRSLDSRSHSVEWDPRSPLLPAGSSPMIRDPVPDQASESLEIDCSQSDIEVRYVKDGPNKGRWQSASTTSLVGPRQYNVARRQMEPYSSALDSSGAGSNYPTTPDDYQKALSPYVRQSATSPAYDGVSPYAQYVHFKDLVHLRSNSDPRRQRNPEYRVSSPPRFSDYNPTPGSPPKYRYHKHADQPGGHYHISPRDSYSSPADRMVFDPRYARIDPIYEIGPYSPGHPATRHSSFVVDPRRIQSVHPHSHQLHPRRDPANVSAGEGPGPTYPTPVWHDHTSTLHYHTLPHHVQTGQPPRIGATDVDESDPCNVEASLRRHSANAAAAAAAARRAQQEDSRRPTGPVDGANTNSLGRPRKSKDHDTIASGRRRVWSVDDLTRDASVTSHSSSFAERAGSCDLLSPPRSVSSDPPVFSQDRKRDGCEKLGGTDVSETSSSSDSDKLPRAAITSRNSDLRCDAQQSIEQDGSNKSNARRSTSLQDEDSSAVSSLVVPCDSESSEHPPLEGTSSGYDSHNTSHTSDSPPPSLQPCTSNITLQPSCHDHDRTSTASSSDRSRKDTSSVDDKYEWDSEFAMESEILEALRHFGTHKRTGTVSRALLEEIRKLGMDKLHEMEESDFVNLEKAIANRDVFSSDDVTKPHSIDTSDMYTKESMERRCAALKREYQRYQMEQLGHQQDPASAPCEEAIRATSHETPANA